MADSEKRGFILPVSIVSPTDVSRVSREIETIDVFFRQAAIRQSGQQESIPRASKLLDKLVTENQLNLLQEDHRRFIQDSMKVLHSSAPVLHMSFSVDPPGQYVQRIVAWLRKNVHAQALVTVGLQPNIGAGCVIRTTNKIFDFSLREYFKDKRGFFIEKMHEATSEQPLEPMDAPVTDEPAPAQPEPGPAAPEVPAESQQNQQKEQSGQAEAEVAEKQPDQQEVAA